MRRVLAVVLLLVVGASSCSKDSAEEAASFFDDGVPGAVDKQPDDVEQDRLKEKVKTRRIDQLQEQAAKVWNVCEVWRELDNIPPPDPRNRAVAVKHAERMYSTLKLFDPTRTVAERVEASGGRAPSVRKVLPPAEVVSDIEVMRKAWYAHWIRLTVYDDWFRGGTIDQVGLARRTSTAFLLLTADEQTSAQRRLADFEASHCHL